MKKIISSILCISLLASLICVPVSATSSIMEEANINDFINGVTKLTQKYDADKDFEVTSEDIISESISDDAPLYYSASSVSENETDDVHEIDFQTCRLIVQNDIDFNNYNALETVSGFENFHILQYKTEADTKTAYENLLNNPDIISVDILDAAYVELVTSGHKQLTDAYFLAADTNSDEEISVEDYAQVVNLVLQT